MSVAELVATDRVVLNDVGVGIRDPDFDSRSPYPALGSPPAGISADVIADYLVARENRSRSRRLADPSTANWCRPVLPHSICSQRAIEQCHGVLGVVRRSCRQRRRFPGISEFSMSTPLTLPTISLSLDRIRAAIQNLDAVL